MTDLLRPQFCPLQLTQGRVEGTARLHLDFCSSSFCVHVREGLQIHSKFGMARGHAGLRAWTSGSILDSELQTHMCRHPTLCPVSAMCITTKEALERRERSSQASGWTACYSVNYDGCEAGMIQSEAVLNERTINKAEAIIEDAQPSGECVDIRQSTIVRRCKDCVAEQLFERTEEILGCGKVIQVSSIWVAVS